MTDRRTPEQVQQSAFFAVTTDSFLSGWGLAKGRSLFAVACPSLDIAEKIETRLHNHTEFKRIRITKNLPRTRQNDHLSIVWHGDYRG